MGYDKTVRCYDYVNHPYESVRDALSADALAVFRNATKAAASRARNLASELRVNLGAIEVGAEIAIDVPKIENQPRQGMQPPLTVLHLHWQAANQPRLFPVMHAELSVYPLSATETQLDFSGRYEPPFGPLGGALDAMLGHRIAEASVHRFIEDVAAHLRKTLA